MFIALYKTQADTWVTARGGQADVSNSFSIISSTSSGRYLWYFSGFLVKEMLAHLYETKRGRCQSMQGSDWLAGFAAQTHSWHYQRTDVRCVWSPARSPLQEGLVGIRHHFLLGLTDGVSLLFVRDGPTLLDLTQLLQTVVKTLRGQHVRSAAGSVSSYDGRNLGTSELTLNLSLMTCRSLSLSWRTRSLEDQSEISNWRDEH